jgi:hypothetical protein
VGGIERRKNSAERETGKRAMKSWKRTQREEGGGRREEGGGEGVMAVFMVVEKAARLVRLHLA